MTEDEAKTKWCPHRRLTEIGDVRITNIDPGIHTLNCIGSDCMMWRIDPPEMERSDVSLNKDVAPEGDGWKWYGAGFAGWYRPRGQGYCGLAGTLPPAMAPVGVGGQSVPTSIARGKMGEPIAAGVYNNPQPGDADFPGGQKTDIGSGG